MLLSVIGLILVHHYARAYHTLVIQHLGDNTYMVPLLSPLQTRIDLAHTTIIASGSWALALRRREPNWLAVTAMTVTISANVVVCFMRP